MIFPFLTRQFYSKRRRKKDSHHSNYSRLISIQEQKCRIIMRYFCRNEKQEGIKENEDRLFLFPKLYTYTKSG